jgi:hypothetical protein
MASMDEIMGYAIPGLLLVIAVSVVYIKFIEPWVIPAMERLWERMKPKDGDGKKELGFD